MGLSHTSPTSMPRPRPCARTAIVPGGCPWCASRRRAVAPSMAMAMVAWMIEVAVLMIESLSGRRRAVTDLPQTQEGWHHALSTTPKKKRSAKATRSGGRRGLMGKPRGWGAAAHLVRARPCRG